MEIRVTHRRQVQRQWVTIGDDALVDAFPTGVDHTVQVDHGADLEIGQVFVPDGDVQPDCLESAGWLCHSTVSRLM